MSNKRTEKFSVDVDGNKTDFYFSKPTHKDILDLDLHYRKMFAEAVRAGIMTNAEAQKQYSDSTAWTDSDESEIAKLMLEIGAMEDILRDKEVEGDVKKEAAIKASSLRVKLLKLNKTKSDLFENTAEAFAEEQKLHKFIMLCLRGEDDDVKFFNGQQQYEEFARDNRDALSTIYRKAYFYDYNLPEDITADWEEVKFLNSIKDERDKDEKKITTKKKTKKRVVVKRGK